MFSHCALGCCLSASNAGQSLKASTYDFRYLDASAQQPSVAPLMPASAKLTGTDGDLFPPMDQNLPEGDLFMRIRAMFPKQLTTAGLRHQGLQREGAGSGASTHCSGHEAGLA